MALRKILTIKDHEKTLREPCKSVEIIDEQVKALANDLLETLRAGDSLGRIGVGLAAPQVGVNISLCVVEYGGEEGKDGKKINHLPTTILVNPKVIKTSNEKETLDEGCFSVPELYGPVVRPKKIKVSALDINGKAILINASGYYARVIQHEMDHLSGVLYTDRVEKGKLYRYVKDEKGGWAVEY